MCTQIVLKIKLCLLAAAIAYSGSSQPIQFQGYLSTGDSLPAMAFSQQTGTQRFHTDNHLNDEDLPVWASWVTFPNGDAHHFDGNQLIVGCKGNTLTVMEPNPIAYTYMLRVYKTSISAVALKSEMEVPHFMVESRLLSENGPILITDEIEGFGTKIEFYDLGLNHMGTLGPSPNGYYYSISECIDSLVWIAINPSSRNEPVKLAAASPDRSNLTEFIEIGQSGWSCKAIIPAGENVVLAMSRLDDKILESKVLLVNTDLKILREVSIPLKYADFGFGFVKGAGNRYYAPTAKTEITCFDSNLNELWKHNIKNLITQQFKRGSSHKPYFQLVGASADGLIVSCITQYKNPTTVIAVVSAEGELIAEFTKTEPFDQESLRIVSFTSKQLVLSDKTNTVSYEW